MTTPWDTCIPEDIAAAYELVGIHILGYSVQAREVVLAWGSGCRADPEFTEMKDGYDGKAMIWRIPAGSPRDSWEKPLDWIADLHRRIALSNAQ